jgi:hypothetical protein
VLPEIGAVDPHGHVPPRMREEHAVFNPREFTGVFERCREIRLRFKKRNGLPAR